MRITIDVTKRDINQAKKAQEKGDFDDCPITCALRRTLGVRADNKMGQDLAVGYDNIYFYPDYPADEVVLASLPPMATAFLTDFDNGTAVEPFSFVANFNKERVKSVGLTLPE